MIDEEEVSLLPSTVRDIPTGRWRNRQLMVLPILVFTLCAAVMLYVVTPETPESAIATAAVIDLQIDVFHGAKETIRATNAERDGPVSFLDRQNLDCGPVQGVLTGFYLQKMGESVQFSYTCYSSTKITELSKVIKRTTEHSGQGGLDNLEQHRVYCDDNSLLTRWAGLTELGEFSIEYYCKTYDIGEYICHDKNTNFSPVGPENSLVYLDRHAVKCNDGEGLKDSFTPTHKPTALPTKKPSAIPTTEPTWEPTAEPTARPTANPTLLPTYAPSYSPSVNPSSEPTKEPTLGPTTSETFVPTPIPTLGPTENPTMEPTLRPTAEPTFEPTPDPTEEPTITYRPSKEPTLEPSAFPTVFSEPSAKPTYETWSLKMAKVSAEPATVCTLLWTKGKSSVTIPKGCALFAKHNLDWLIKGQSTPAFYACGKNSADILIRNDDFKRHGFVDKDGDSMLTAIIPGPSTVVTFYSKDNFEGFEHTYTENWHAELSHFHFMGSTETLHYSHEHVRSAIVRTFAESISHPPNCSTYPRDLKKLPPRPPE